MYYKQYFNHAIYSVVAKTQTETVSEKHTIFVMKWSIKTDALTE